MRKSETDNYAGDRLLRDYSRNLPSHCKSFSLIAGVCVCIAMCLVGINSSVLVLSSEGDLSFTRFTVKSPPRKSLSM